MPVAIYTVRRSLVSPLTVGTQIVYVMPIAYAGKTRSREAFVTKHRSLSGLRAAYYQSADVAWDLTTIPLFWDSSPASDYLLGAQYVVMFLDSLESGEVFGFDPDATPATVSPNYINCVLDGTGYVEPRRPELDTLYTYNFRIVTAGSSYP